MTRRNSSAPYDDMSHRTRNKTVNIVSQDYFWSALQTTPHGYAWMEGTCGADHDGITRIWFVWQGREYMRTYERFYGPTWVARLATAFARDVVEGRVGNA